MRIGRGTRSIIANTFARILGSGSIATPPIDWSPIFLIGSGRSGTTITGRLIGNHSDVLYLNEPRYLWRAADPRTDIWQYQDQNPGAQVILTSEDHTEQAELGIRRMFYRMQRLAGKSVLLEKLPINSFRVGYLNMIFPTARYIHLIRHGLEVAYSISRQKGWSTGRSSFRWSQIENAAIAAGVPRSFFELDLNKVERGLVEWTLSVEASRSSLGALGSEQSLTIRYEQLLENPDQTLASILEFMNLQPESRVLRLAEEAVDRRSPPAKELKLPSQVLSRTLDLLREMGYQV